MFANDQIKAPKTMNNHQQTKAYDMIRQAIGQKTTDNGPNYTQFSNIYSLSGQGTNFCIQAVASRKQQTVKAKGTTMTDPNKTKNDQILSQFKSKILQ